MRIIFDRISIYIKCTNHCGLNHCAYVHSLIKLLLLNIRKDFLKILFAVTISFVLRNYWYQTFFF